MKSKYTALLNKLHKINDVEKAIAVLHWDSETNMPALGASRRVAQVTSLNEIAHSMFASTEMGDLIAAAQEEQAGEAYDSTAASMLRVVEREYKEQMLFTAEFVRRRSDVTGTGGAAWAQMREENNFAGFASHLAAAVAIAQETAEIRGYESEPYDGLLSQYERGMTSAQLRKVFAEVKKETVPLLQAIAQRSDKVDDKILQQTFPVATQEAMCRYGAESIGYDFKRGHLGEVHHPFSTSFGRDDVRITTRYSPEYAMSSLFGTMHEAGHAMYEQGIAQELDRSPLGQGASLGIHESQSRLFENQVGRSLGYWQAHFGKLQTFFPEQLSGVKVEDFYRAINKVQPSLIRVEADELTYNMHIIVRFELEQALINNEIKVNDLPAAWNDKMKSLLGIVPDSDKKGVLQDVHWSQAAFGYFPTYTLGNLYSAQFMASAKAQDAQIESELGEGKNTRLLAWLRSNIHQHGNKYDAAELCMKATGQSLSPEPFLQYVREKYGAIYEL